MGPPGDRQHRDRRRVSAHRRLSVGNLRLPQLDVATSGRRNDGWPSPSIRRWNTRSRCPGGWTRWPCPSSPPVGGAQPAPLLACRLAPGPSRWSIATRPRRPEITVDETLVLDFDGQRGGGAIGRQLDGFLRRRLPAPAAGSPRVEDRPHCGVGRRPAAAPPAGPWTPAERLRSSSWTRASGAYELTLRGRLPAAAGTKLPLPQIEIESARVQSFTLQLYRRPPVLVEVDHAAG